MKVETQNPVFARNRHLHHKFPRLWDKNGRPVMAVAKADELVECQEVHKNPMCPRQWRNAAIHAARRGYKSHTRDACVEWYSIAVRCLKRSWKLSGDWVDPVGEIVCLVGLLAVAVLAMAVA